MWRDFERWHLARGKSTLSKLALVTLAAVLSTILRALAARAGDALILLANLAGDSSAGAADSGSVAEVIIDSDNVGLYAVGGQVLDDDVARSSRGVVGAWKFISR